MDFNQESVKQPYILYVGDETRIVVEDEKKKDRSIFKEVYDEFFDELTRILPNIVGERKNTVDELTNNIFSFVGERGAGKTSCMMSVASMLQHNDKNPVLNNDSKYSFEVLAPTDPSFFSNNKNIIDVFLGRLFVQFRNRIEKGKDVDRNKKDNLLSAFGEVKQTLSFMGKDSCVDEESNIDSLLGLSAAAELTNAIQNLIDKYLEFVGKNVLVIPVDDIDLHTLYAYEMAEQIRKYLIQKNTIVLMALKIEQLEKVVERHYVEYYDKLINKKVMNSSDVVDMANRYIVKLIPQAHRFVLKSVDDLLEEKFVIMKDNVPLEDVTEKNLKDIVTSFIFRKTRYLFYNSEKNANLIIPRNLREIRHFIEFLYSMNDYTDNLMGDYNKKRFRDHFLKVWINNLSVDDQITGQKLFEKTDAKSINKNVVEILAKKFANTSHDDIPMRYRRLSNGALVPVFGDRTEIDYITDVKNTVANISTGDVLAVVRYCQEKASSDLDQAFLFFIETLYSMRLYEFYNEKTDVKKTENDAESIGYTSKIDQLNKYEVLVAGAFFNEMDDVLVKHFSRPECYRRPDYRVIALDNVIDILEKSLDADKKSVKDINKFRALELIAIMLTRKYDFSADDRLYRTKRDVFYLGEFERSDFAWLSVYSIFANLTNIEMCYERLSTGFYKLAQTESGSLLNRLRQWCELEKKGNPHSFESCVSIRNINVVKKLWDEILDVIPQGKSLIDLIEILRTFERFGMSTYDLRNRAANERYKINFSFVNVIISCIKENYTLFEEIYEKTESKTSEKIEIISCKLAKLKAENDQDESPRTLSDYADLVDKKIRNFAEEMPLNKSFSLVASKLREYFDSPIRSESAFARASNNFENWLKTLPVVD